MFLVNKSIYTLSVQPVFIPILFADINECSEGTNICQQLCINADGYYNCSCVEGYSLQVDGSSCTLQGKLQMCSNVLYLEGKLPMCSNVLYLEGKLPMYSNILYFTR